MESVRTCAGCRKKRPKTQLLRFVAQGPRLVPDPLMVERGRGAYLCASATCLDRAVVRGGFARALRRRLSLSPERVREVSSSRLRSLIAALWQQMVRDGRLALVSEAPNEERWLGWDGSIAVPDLCVEQRWQQLLSWSTFFEAELTGSV